MLRKSIATLLPVAVFAIELLLHGCAPGPVIMQPPPESALPEANRQSPAGYLYAQAQAATAAGDHDGAEALLERALRVDPGNGRLWYSMAQSKFERGDFSQTVQFGLKAASLAGTDHTLERASWRLIEQSWRALGDMEKADDARARWQRL